MATAGAAWGAAFGNVEPAVETTLVAVAGANAAASAAGTPAQVPVGTLAYARRGWNPVVLVGGASIRPEVRGAVLWPNGDANALSESAAADTEGVLVLHTWSTRENDLHLQQVRYYGVENAPVAEESPTGRSSRLPPQSGPQRPATGKSQLQHQGTVGQASGAGSSPATPVRCPPPCPARVPPIANGP